MKIVVAGGSGFLGSALVRSWRADGHVVAVLTRRVRAAGDVAWAPEAGGAPLTSLLDQTDVVVNLAGAGIADRRWSAARKTAILESRVTPTRALAAAILACTTPPPLFLSASGVGFYGTRGDEPVTESSGQGSDFLATVCAAWEQEARRAEPVARVVLLRTGLVLGRDGGALPRMALPFRFFAGGTLGSGRQYLPWIHLLDWGGMVRWAVDDHPVSGPLNLTAPSPVTNAEFTRVLARTLHRPAILPAPAFALRTLLGREMADSLLLGGQRALPDKAQRLGYRFQFTELDVALRDVLGPS
jgi:uncharacterized protein (TIGR01777 family)